MYGLTSFLPLQWKVGGELDVSDLNPCFSVGSLLDRSCSPDKAMDRYFYICLNYPDVLEYLTDDE
jgi:hypothetical protein